MKTFLQTCRLLIAALFIVLPAKIFSQSCTVRNLVIKVNSITSTPSSCIVNATISWIQASNSANSYTNVHIWTSANYPSPVLGYSKPPSASDLANALGTFVIDNPGSTTPTFDGTYPPANGVTLISKTASTMVSKTPNVPSAGLDSFNVSNVLITLSNSVSCANHFILKADVWSAQSSKDQTIQCSSTNGTFATADVNVSGQIMCNTPRQFQTAITTTSPTTVNFTYAVYADEAHTGSYAQSDPMIYSGSGSAINGAGYNSGVINNTTYPGDNLITVVQVSGNPVSTFGVLTNACIVNLPVNLVYFNARREGAGIMLSWVTAAEHNNAGFEVERKIGAGDFQAIGYVPTKAFQGNSDASLTYGYTDADSFTDDVQYRLVQIDLDGQYKYSPLAVIEGKSEGSGLLSVYPNPSRDGNITLSFGNTDKKDIIVGDLSGKVLKMIRGISANNYAISGLPSGIFVLKVVNTANGQANISKILVGK